jgi:hypothetical protein
LNPRPLGYEQAERRPSPARPVASTCTGLSRRYRGVSACLITSSSFRGVLVTTMVTRAEGKTGSPPRWSPLIAEAFRVR